MGQFPEALKEFTLLWQLLHSDWHRQLFYHLNCNYDQEEEIEHAKVSTEKFLLVKYTKINKSSKKMDCSLKAKANPNIIKEGICFSLIRK